MVVGGSTARPLQSSVDAILQLTPRGKIAFPMSAQMGPIKN